MAHLTLLLFLSFALLPFCDCASYDCTDSDGDCPLLASQSHCYRSKAWMMINCRKSCHVCESVNNQCVDSTGICQFWAAKGECKISIWMRKNCKASCKLCDNGGGHHYPPHHPKPSHSTGHHYPPQPLTYVPASHYGPKPSKKKTHSKHHYQTIGGSPLSHKSHHQPSGHHYPPHHAPKPHPVHHYPPKPVHHYPEHPPSPVHRYPPKPIHHPHHDNSTCNPLNVVFVVDVSENIDSDDLLGIELLMEAINLRLPYGSKVAVVSFAESAETVMHYVPAFEAKGKFDLTFKGGYTYVTKALNHVKNLMFSSPGYRKDVVIMITDGDFEDGLLYDEDELEELFNEYALTAIADAAAALRNNATLVVISSSESELDLDDLTDRLDILTENADDKFSVADFGVLEMSVIDTLEEKFCKKPKKPEHHEPSHYEPRKPNVHHHRYPPHPKPHHGPAYPLRQPSPYPSQHHPQPHHAPSPTYRSHHPSPYQPQHHPKPQHHPSPYQQQHHPQPQHHAPSPYQQQPQPAHTYAPPTVAQPQPIQPAQNGKDVKCQPLDVAYMVDVGSNIKGSELTGIRTFLRYFTGYLPRDSEVGLVGFAEEIETVFDWLDRNEASGKVFRLPLLGGSTYVTPALDYTRRRFFKRNESPNKKIVIVITKGDFDDKTRNPTSYGKSILKAAKELGEHARIYVITPQANVQYDNIAKLATNRIYRADSFQRFGEPVLWQLVKELCYPPVVTYAVEPEPYSAPSMPAGYGPSPQQGYGPAQPQNGYGQPSPQNGYGQVQNNNPYAQMQQGGYGQPQGYGPAPQTEAPVYYEPECHPVDIVYVTDVSNSLSATSMARMKVFLRNLTENLLGGSLVSMVSFAEQADEIFPFTTATSAMRLIGGVKMVGGRTLLSEALDYARRNLFMNDYDKKNVVLIITDGDIEDDIREAADELNDFAEVFMVVPERSIQTPVIKDDLLILTESEDNIITVQDFTRFAQKTVDATIEKLCHPGTVARVVAGYRPHKAGQQFAPLPPQTPQRTYGSIHPNPPINQGQTHPYEQHGNPYEDHSHDPTCKELNVVLLVDVSEGVTEEELIGTAAFLRSVTLRLPVGSQVALLAFADDTQVIFDFLPIYEAKKQFRNLEEVTAGGQAYIADTLELIRADYFEDMPNDFDNIVLIVTDGQLDDSSSIASAASKLDELTDIYVVTPAGATEKSERIEQDLASLSQDLGHIQRVQNLTSVPPSVIRNVVFNLCRQKCEDFDTNCAIYDCASNEGYMREHCAKSCGICL